MDLKVNNHLQNLNSHQTSLNKNEQVELFNLMNFRFDDGRCVSTKEMRVLPAAHKNEIRNVFLRIIEQKDVKQEIKESNTSSISIQIVDGKLAYSLDGSTSYKVVQDKKIQKAFKRASKHIKLYLEHTGSLAAKQISASSEDLKILKTAPSDVEKVSKEYFKKMKKSDTEWSLWAIWVCELRASIKKICGVLGIGINWISVPKGVDDILGDLFGGFGILNGIEMERDSKKINDKEGVYDGRHKISRNIIAMVGGAIDFVGKVLSTAGNVLVKAVLGLVASILFIFVTIYVTLRYVYFGLKALGFKRKMDRYLENDKLIGQTQMISTLKFLKSKVTISEDESLKIVKKVRKQNPTLSDQKIKQIAHGRIAQKLLTKVKRFERRAGSGIVSMIHKNVDQILKDPTNKANIEKAFKIIDKVKDKNNMIIHENMWYAIATALQGLEIVLMIAFGMPLYADIAGALSSTIVMIILLGIYFHRKHISKVDKDEDRSMLDENLDMLTDPSI